MVPGVPELGRRDPPKTPHGAGEEDSPRESRARKADPPKMLAARPGMYETGRRGLCGGLKADGSNLGVLRPEGVPGCLAWRPSLVQ